MAQVRNEELREGGEFMIQDHDHLAAAKEAAGKSHRGSSAKQVQQSHSGSRQHGSGDHNTRRQSH